MIRLRELLFGKPVLKDLDIDITDGDDLEARRKAREELLKADVQLRLLEKRAHMLRGQ